MYNFYEDPGHGWLKVPIKELTKLNIADKITGFSYMQNDYAYLEEDCDLSTFINAKYSTDEEKRNFFKTKIKTFISNKNSKIRNYNRFKIYSENELKFINEVKNKMFLLFTAKYNQNTIKKKANLETCEYWNENYNLGIDKLENN